ncbi:glucosamine-6-phosphate deaminase [Sporosarcina sp. Marseille-Q4063]|uniref:glucosamine-6-phosphate deaminase n=1 Tax=Sporosarcina sp. Marseille-Q4063 TaxID=2810514 RepID=UPI001BAF2FA8|nr:glucosamine-6-phosphate deaminase [Sporosarcina sp. Marseille-Q4063]QUW21469.1 glucosamine-6-phosphate deaminase [Sporosarcina sp. Marseille-Q4063]
MKVIVRDNYDEVSKEASRLVEEKIRENDELVLGLATGATPLGLYENLIDSYKTRGISYENVKTINLDEYLGLDKNHPASYHAFMFETFFKHIDIELNNTYIPDGVPASAEEECLRYEAVIDHVGPVDLQILGIGTNGHIGFNEPGTDPNSLTHVVELNASTIENNAHFFQSIDEVPTHAITIGIQSILKSDQVILLASGKSKAKAVKTLLESERNVNPDFPASYLWTHDDVTIIVDKDAYQLV